MISFCSNSKTRSAARRRAAIQTSFSYPWGAHYLPVPFQENTELIALLDEMNLTEGRTANGEIVVKEQFFCREPEERIFYKGRWYEGLYLNVGASGRRQTTICRISKTD